ncbi:hypothetical protein SPF06_01050 [Sinomonas sp. JGH33]|uniref:Uncharacterized protein n=1 Tax=Sinomonas terricola TaxID=3110330 RepID=A0ABU5T0V3_9MICC|nr:hypothetical protein [Sinomonas sp. JGH33]MEA5453298.1 hypothetical protein [Sinomonas sp. JGH33]
MSDDPTPYVRALAEEYRRCVQAGAAHITICVVEELTRHGWNFDDQTGGLVRIQERAVVKSAPETPESPAPRRRAATLKE